MRYYTKWKTELRKKTGSLLGLPGRRPTLGLRVLTNLETDRTQLPHYNTALCSKTPREATEGTDTDKKGPSLVTSLSKGRYFQVWWPRWICRGPDFLLHLEINAASRPSSRTCLYTCSMPFNLSMISPPRWTCRQSRQELSVLKASGPSLRLQELCKDCGWLCTTQDLPT